MSIAESFLPEFDMEMANTRKVLERVPDDKLGWKPHEKSGTMGWLADHCAFLPGWCKETFTLSELDLSPEGKPFVPAPAPATNKALLEKFDQGAAAGRAALAAASDEAMMQPWSLLMTGKPIFTLPRIAVYRGTIMNHLIHHRAQLVVYLRLNNVPVPGLYGPSADEQAFG
jgi:uncharacterized damage-inducible protein DinB